MNKILKVFGIIALVAVIGFTMTGCKEEDSGGAGTLTITGIPATYNDFMTGDHNLNGLTIEAKQAGNINATTKFVGGKITNGTATFSVESPFGNIGTGSMKIYFELKYGDAIDDLFATTKDVDFKNGTATLKWSELISY